MKRRGFLAGMAALVTVPDVGYAEQTQKVRRIAVLWHGSPGAIHMREPFVMRLRELGWRENQNVVIEWRYAEGHSERLPTLAVELVKGNIELIVAGIGTIDAAMGATRHVPIVMTFGVTASEAGVLGSLARPGRNVTGLTGDVTTEVMSKRLELLREVAPHARRVVALHAPIPDAAAYIADFEAGAQKLRFSLQYVEVRRVEDLDAAFAKVRDHRPDALYCGGDPLTMRVIPRIVEFARQHRIPSIHGPRQFADAGGLIAYGVSLTAIYRRAAEYVHSILNGASPSDLPIERPPKYDLVVNLKTARALSMTIPQSVLARADHVIE